ncbi:MAG: SusC/RagA family TonB-linked outer membrane protein, partial [Bacteroidales bacterium]|nr:SusC/RagA family TonB-linked outer membrane protein [Bacteroidales bacterium]
SIIGGHSENLLKNINVKDIDRVIIIKDGTALYGSKGSNGVILIETKKAQNVITKIDFTAYAGISTAPKQIPMLDAGGFRSYANEFLATKGLSADDIQYGYKWLNMTPLEWDYPKYANNTSWLDEIYDNAYIQDYHLGIKGGDEIAKYALSVGYLSNGSTLRNTKYQRYSTRMNGDLQITKNFKLISSIGYSFSDNNLLPTGLSEASNPIYNSLVKPALFSAYDILRNIDGTPVTTTILADVDPLGISNPVVLVNKVDASSNTNQFTGLVDFQYTISRSLSAAAMVGINYAKVTEEIFIPSLGVGLIDGTEYERQAGRNINNYSNVNGDIRINYSKQYGTDHYISAKLGVRYYASKLSNDNNSDFSMPNDEFKGLGSGSSLAATTALDKKRITSFSGEWKTISNYLTANYNYANKYYATLGISADMSSQFASGKVGVFPSLNLAWRLKEERFLKDNPLLNDLKLRAGISMSGNDNIGYFAARESYEASRYRSATGLVKENLTNDNLKWETTQTLNIGMDVSLLTSRLRFGFDLFTMKTSDVVLFEILPASYGYDGYWNNSATTGTKGFELSVNSLLLDVGGFKWQTGANLSRAKSEVISLPGGVPIITEIPGGHIITQEGGPLYQFYGYKSDGIFESASEVPAGLQTADGRLFGPGDMKYVQVEEDGILDSKDWQVIGDAEADFYGGIYSTMSFKGISLGVSFDFKSGNQIFNFARMQTEGMTSLINQSSAVNMRWTQEGDQTSIPRISVNMPENAAFSSRWIEDGSYLRLRSLNLAYNIPVKKGLIQGVKVFLQTDNLFIWSKYLGSSPIFSYGRNSLYQGADYLKEPQTRTVLFGISLDL